MSPALIFNLRLVFGYFVSALNKRIYPSNAGGNMPNRCATCYGGAAQLSLTS